MPSGVTCGLCLFLAVLVRESDRVIGRVNKTRPSNPGGHRPPGTLEYPHEYRYPALRATPRRDSCPQRPDRHKKGGCPWMISSPPPPRADALLDIARRPTNVPQAACASATTFGPTRSATGRTPVPSMRRPSVRPSPPSNPPTSPPRPCLPGRQPGTPGRGSRADPPRPRRRTGTRVGRATARRVPLIYSKNTEDTVEPAPPGEPLNSKRHAGGRADASPPPPSPGGGSSPTSRVRPASGPRGSWS
jgi:hypothetical protein